MNAILAGLLEENRSLRFQSILALEEMARRFPNLQVDREIIESAIVSDVMLYAQRFAFFFVLFTDAEQSSVENAIALAASASRKHGARERADNLAAVPDLSIQGYSEVFGALSNSGDSAKQANAVELLDNLLTGDVKRYIFPFYGDTLAPERFRMSLQFLGLASLDAQYRSPHASRTRGYMADCSNRLGDWHIELRRYSCKHRAVS